MARGLNDYGYEYPALADIIEETKKSFKDSFGQNFNTDSNSVADKMITLFCEREYQLWLLGGMVYSAQTIQGAEGIFLDDLLSQRGIYRNGKTKSTGQIQIYLDKTLAYNTTLLKSAYSINSGDFVFENDVMIAGNISGHRILNSDITPGTYSLSIFNPTTATTNTFNYVLTSKIPGSSPLNGFLSGIKNFIVANTIESNEDRIFIDTTEGSIYIGYNSDKEFVGLNNNVDLRINPLIGTRVIEVDVVAAEAGLKPVGINSINNISPTPAGFLSIGNITEFTGGSNSETDAEYKTRALQAVSSAGSATRPAIIAKLLSVPGVQRIKLFNNPTPNTDSFGVPPYKFIPVVYGGTTEDISRALYEVIAASNNTWGETSFVITTEDGQPERIYHTKASVVQLSLRIKYSTVNGKVLTSDEQILISTALENLVNSVEISGTLYNVQLVAEAVSAITDGRFSDLHVEVKLDSDPDTAYTEADFTTGLGELLSLNDSNIVYLQV